MKKLLFILLLLPMYVASQNFPGYYVDVLIGKELLVLAKEENLQKYGYDYFFKDKDLGKKYACCQNYNSKYKALCNKLFTVERIEPYIDVIGQSKFKLEIRNSEIGTLYFDYDPLYEHKFPFEVVDGFEFYEDFFCRYIKEKVDKFSENKSYISPAYEPIVIIKSKGIIGMRIEVEGSTANVSKKGAILLLENGAKLEKPEAEIEVEVNRKTKAYSYSTFFRLSEEDIALLSENKIIDVRLYIYDLKIDSGEAIKGFIRCLSKE